MTRHFAVSTVYCVTSLIRLFKSHIGFMQQKRKQASYIEKKSVVIRFAGDSGDGMQVTGQQLTSASAVRGNDVHTLPDFPAEIRAPAGTVAGVSGFQLCISSDEVHTAGDVVDTLIAMNPAALAANLADVVHGGIVIVDSDKFTERDFTRAKLSKDPLKQANISHYRLVEIPISSLSLKAVEPFSLPQTLARKCKNMFALGLIAWLYQRDLEPIQEWLAEKYSKEDVVKANHAALKAGYDFAVTIELFNETYDIKPASLAPGWYRHLTGNQAISYACYTAAHLSQKTVFLAGYPITPASDILHEVTKHPDLNVITFQAEDEIAACCSAIGAAFGGDLAVTCTSGPGLDLKQESIGLALMVELPLVIIDVQRGGPSTGLPTKTEQSDLLSAIYGRHGEGPVVVIAPNTPSNCFDTVLEAFRIAVKHMMPVIVLSDANLANGAEPWNIPNIDELEPIQCEHPQAPPSADLQPYLRNPETGARPWIIPGMKEMTHRIGGLEKSDKWGHVSYDSQNHQTMTQLRQDKLKKVQQNLPKSDVFGAESGKLLVISWGSTYGTILSAVETLLEEGLAVAMLHLRYLNPLPDDLGEILEQYETILVPELNTGQLKSWLNIHYPKKMLSYCKVAGKPFSIAEMKTHIQKVYNGQVTESCFHKPNISAVVSQ